MACGSCYRRRNSSSQNVTPPDSVVDFNLIGPSQTKIRSGNGQYYSIMIPLVKMRPPIGWGIWIKVKDHDHFIQANTAQEVVREIIARYANNGITIDEKTAWFNANKIWVTRMNPRHSYATLSDLNAISKSLVDPLIWKSEEWDKIKMLVKSEDYNPYDTQVEIHRLFTLAQNKTTGCEVCYDELTNNPYTIENQDSMKLWVETRYNNIVKSNVG